MDPITQQVVLATAGAAGAGDKTYVDDVFSTYLFDSTGSTQTITNGIDLSGEGGLVWIKRRSAADPGCIFDTERGANKLLRTTSAGEEVTSFSDLLTSFNSNGFSLGADSGGFGTNPSSSTMVSWSFRKAPGFFDVVTYTGTGSAQNISHSLGSAPGMIIVKCTSDGSTDWTVFHRKNGHPAFSNGGSAYASFLNTTAAADPSSAYWNSTVPTSTVFTVGVGDKVNGNNKTYVAYLFAHDDQSFGTSSDEAIIKCDSYTGASAFNTPLEVNVGFEPQWVLIKDADSTRGWVLLDTMRGWPAIPSESSRWLRPDVSNAESGGTFGYLTSTGFVVNNSSYVNGSSNTFVYMAIRRPHKPPTVATNVFNVINDAGNTSGGKITAGNLVDLVINKSKNSASYPWYWLDRLRGPYAVKSSSNAAESNSQVGSTTFDEMDGIFVGSADGWSYQSPYGGPYAKYFFTRAAGFFDVVAYTGNGTNNHQITHNLGVVPEFALFKERTNSDSWVHFHDMNASTYFYSFLNTGPGAAQSYGSGARMFAQPNTTTLFLSDYATMNQSGENYICYLFASLAGISKIGTYSGTGSNIDVDCGFTAGARFVLIKSTSNTGDWYVWDSVSGIVSGNDPYLLFNSDAVQATSYDYIDPLNAGFTVTSSAPAALNTSGGTYLFLAIA